MVITRRKARCELCLPEGWSFLKMGMEHGCRTPNLRHTYAAWCIAGGMDTYTLSKRMGTGEEQIRATYGHLLKDSARRDRDTLGAWKRASSARQRSRDGFRVRSWNRLWGASISRNPSAPSRYAGSATGSVLRREVHSTHIWLPHDEPPFWRYHYVCCESGCADLNRGPLVPQTSALTRLRHTPR